MARSIRASGDTIGTAAVAIVVTAVELLLAGFGSLAEVTVAVLLLGPAVADDDT